MSTDRELLEAAARAAGLTLEWTSSNDFGDTFEPFCWLRRSGPHNRRDGDGKVWNPLTDDGDALRLAVKLGIEVRDVHQYDRACAYLPTSMQEFWEHAGPDPYAATRRAIVRAAAALAEGAT